MRGQTTRQEETLSKETGFPLSNGERQNRLESNYFLSSGRSNNYHTNGNLLFSDLLLLLQVIVVGCAALSFEIEA